MRHEDALTNISIFFSEDAPIKNDESRGSDGRGGSKEEDYDANGNDDNNYYSNEGESDSENTDERKDPYEDDESRTID